MRGLLCLGGVLLASTALAAGPEQVAPLPLPKVMRVEGAGPRGKVWQRLSPKEKKLAYYLIKAADAGRDLLFYRNHRHALAIKHVLETALNAKNLPATKELLGEKPFAEFLIYAAKFLDQAGPYSASNRKYVLHEVTPDQVQQLLARHAARLNDKARGEIVRLLTDPNYEVRQYPENPDGAGLEKTGNNYYQKGITGPEVARALKNGLDPTLNSRVVRKGDGLALQTQTVQSPGMVGDRLRKVVAALEAARPFACTDHQKSQLEHLIKYFRDGNVEEFRQMNIDWVRDRDHSPVDFMMGWVEFYGDYRTQMASWESYVQIVDPAISKKAQALAHSAQYFEDHMPYGKYRKHFPSGYSPPAIMVYYFQEISPIRTGGYNLPNFDDIRRDVGAKNVIRLPLPGQSKDPDIQKMRRAALEAYLPADKIDVVMANSDNTWRNLVLMHEIIGHGSGTYDTSKYGKTEDPVGALGGLGSALEEQRADLTALLFAGDPKLVEIGLCKDAGQAKLYREVTYDSYLADFLRRTAGGRSFTEIHQRGHWLFINKLLKAGAIHWAAKDGHSTPTLENQVLVVTDYDKFHKVVRDLLEELQAIKANREEAKLKQLFTEDAPLDAIHEPWAQAIIHRGANLLINAGYVEQPWGVTSRGAYESFGGKTLDSIAPYWTRSAQGRTSPTHGAGR